VLELGLWSRREFRLGLGLAAPYLLTMNQRISDYESDRQRVWRDGHFRRPFLVCWCHITRLST